MTETEAYQRAIRAGATPDEMAIATLAGMTEAKYADYREFGVAHDRAMELDVLDTQMARYSRGCREGDDPTATLVSALEVGDAMRQGNATATGWRAAGFTVQSAATWAAAGIDAGDAASWLKADFAPDEAADWSDMGFDAEAASDWRTFDFDSGEASSWSSWEFDPSEADNWCHSQEIAHNSDTGIVYKRADGIVDPEVAHAWRYAGCDYDKAQAWNAVGIDVGEARRWSNNDIGRDISDPDEAKTWVEAGFDAETGKPWIGVAFDPDRSRSWSDCGFDAEEAEWWAEAVVNDPVEAQQWRTGGFSPTDDDTIARWRDAGWASEVADDIHQLDEAGFSPEDAADMDMWAEVGFTVEQAGKWQFPRQIEEDKSRPITATEAVRWLSAGFSHDEGTYAHSWKAAGFNPENVKRWHNAGLDPRQARATVTAMSQPIPEVPEPEGSLSL